MPPTPPDPVELESVRQQLQAVLEEIDACPEKVARVRLYSAKMLPILTDPVLSELERYAYLDRAWDYCKFPKEVAKRALDQAVLDRLLDPMLADLRAWREQCLEEGVSLPPDSTTTIAKVGATIRDIATLERKPRDAGVQYVLGYLVDLKVPNGRTLVDEALLVAQRSAAEDLDPEQLRLAAASVLAHEDPLVLVLEDIKKVYGGDTTGPMLAYLSMTSRALLLRKGGLLFHLQLLGEPSTGKTWAYKTAERLLPESSVIEYQSGTPRVLIYDARPFVHKVVIFSEIGSIPTDKDHQPVAVAFRKLVEENFLQWDLVVKDEVTGSHRVEIHRREGPTVLITTGTTRMEAQMDSRLFVYELPEDVEQNRHSIIMQTALEEEGALPEPSAALVAFQGLLQTMAPVHVVIPYVKRLGARLAALGGVDSRVRRDVNKLYALVKTVALIRHAHRTVNAAGAIEATIDDYRFVRDLIASQYIVGGGPSDRIREVVEIVTSLYKDAAQPITASAVAKAMGISGQAGWAHIQRAVQSGWIVNAEPRKGMPANLQPGEAMPGRVNLPTPEDVLREDYSTPGEGAPEGEEAKTPLRVERTAYRVNSTGNNGLNPPLKGGVERLSVRQPAKRRIEATKP